MPEYMWWEQAAGIPELVESGYLDRAEGEDGLVHYNLTASGVDWIHSGDGAEEVRLP